MISNFSSFNLSFMFIFDVFWNTLNSSNSFVYILYRFLCCWNFNCIYFWKVSRSLDLQMNTYSDNNNNDNNNNNNNSNWLILYCFISFLDVPFERSCSHCSSSPVTESLKKFWVQKKILVSRSYMTLWLPEIFWYKTQNGQLVPNSPIFKMMKNNHSAHFHMWGQNSNTCN